MDTIWINIAIAIAQIIIMFAIGYWQISVAKSIARDEIGKKISIKSRLRIFLSKHSSKGVKFFILFNLYIMYSFVKSQPPTRIEILHLVFTTVITSILVMLDFHNRLLDLIEKSHKNLYCMICKRSEEKKPICIEQIISESET